MQPIDYYFWLNSDWAYLGADRLEDLAARQGAKIRYMPVDLPYVYSKTGGVILPLRAPERQAYRVAELERWCARLDIHVNPNPRFMCPDAGLASRIVIAADMQGIACHPLYKAILHAEWCDDQDISDEATLRSIIHSLHLDDESLVRDAESARVKTAYSDYTHAAIAAGVFGSPTYVYRGEVFWGQDRLDFLEEAIARSAIQPWQATAGQRT
jgi:2-hydroxychromene-2-carboxylate isomerase